MQPTHSHASSPSPWLSALAACFIVSSPALADDVSDVGPQVGEPFGHALSAPDQHGREQSLEALMGERGLVLFFVRSADWCPFCQAQLAEMNDRLAEFEALGLRIAAVSVDDVAAVAAFAAEHDIGYAMLADPAGDINEALGIRDPQYPVGSAAFGVPRAVLYVIDRNGVVRARYMEPTYRTRPDLDAVLQEAAALAL